VSGFSWLAYGSDDGRTYALKVDDDLVADPGRGWAVAATEADPQYPRGWTPRAVIGMSAEGALRWAIIATLDAPLWTGELDTFHYRDTTGGMVPAVVIGRRQERMLKLPPLSGPSTLGTFTRAVLSVVDPR